MSFESIVTAEWLTIVLILVMLATNNPMLKSTLDSLKGKIFKKSVKEGDKA